MIQFAKSSLNVFGIVHNFIPVNIANYIIIIILLYFIIMYQLRRLTPSFEIRMNEVQYH